MAEDAITLGGIGGSLVYTCGFDNDFFFHHCILTFFYEELFYRFYHLIKVTELFCCNFRIWEHIVLLNKQF